MMQPSEDAYKVARKHTGSEHGPTFLDGLSPESQPIVPFLIHKGALYLFSPLRQGNRRAGALGRWGCWDVRLLPSVSTTKYRPQAAAVRLLPRSSPAFRRGGLRTIPFRHPCLRCIRRIRPQGLPIHQLSRRPQGHRREVSPAEHGESPLGRFWLTVPSPPCRPPAEIASVFCCSGPPSAACFDAALQSRNSAHCTNARVARHLCDSRRCSVSVRRRA